MEEIKKYVCSYKNPYILKNYTKKDLKFTKRAKKQYLFCKKLEDSKIFNKMTSWKVVGNLINKTFIKYKKKISYNFLNMEYSTEYATKKFLESKNLFNNIKLEKLYIYDILPKEYIETYEKGILKFREVCKKGTMFNDTWSLQKHIEEIKNNIHTSAYYNLGYFQIASSIDMGLWFNSVNIVLSEISGYYIIIYELDVQEKANQELSKIFNSLVISEPVFTKHKKLISAYNGRPSSDKEVAINELILEMKYKFIKNISNFVPTFFHSQDKISPSLEVYSLENFDNLKTIGPYINLYGQDYDYNENEGIACNLSALCERNRASRYAIIADKSKDKELKFLDDIFYCYPTQLAEMLVMKSLEKDIEAKILKYQRDLNKLLQNKSSAQNLLKFKIKTLKDIFLYQRYIDAVLKQELIYLDQGYLKSFKNQCVMDFSKGKYQNAASIWLNTEQNKYRLYKEQIDKLFELFDDNLKIVESSSNMLLVKSTLVVSVISAIIALATLFLTNANISNAILDLLKKLINQI